MAPILQISLQACTVTQDWFVVRKKMNLPIFETCLSTCDNTHQLMSCGGLLREQKKPDSLRHSRKQTRHFYADLRDHHLHKDHPQLAVHLVVSQRQGNLEARHDSNSVYMVQGRCKIICGFGEVVAWRCFECTDSWALRRLWDRRCRVAVFDDCFRCWVCLEVSVEWGVVVSSLDWNNILKWPVSTCFGANATGS